MSFTYNLILAVGFCIVGYIYYVFQSLNTEMVKKKLKSIKIAYYKSKNPKYIRDLIFNKATKLFPDIKMLEITQENLNETSSNIVYGLVIGEEEVEFIDEELKSFMEGNGYVFVTFPEAEGLVAEFSQTSNLFYYLATAVVKSQVIKYAKEHNLGAQLLLRIHGPKGLYFFAPVTDQEAFNITLESSPELFDDSSIASSFNFPTTPQLSESAEIPSDNVSDKSTDSPFEEIHYDDEELEDP